MCDTRCLACVSRRTGTEQLGWPHVHGGHVERLEHGLRHALSVGRSFVEQDGMFLRRNPELRMRTVCDTTSQESITMAVVRLVAKRDNAAWIATFMAGTWIVTSMICLMRSR